MRSPAISRCPRPGQLRERLDKLFAGQAKVGDAVALAFGETPETICSDNQ